MVTFYLYDDTPGQAAYAERLEKAVKKYRIEAKIITFTYRNTMLKRIKKNPHQANHIFMTSDGRNFNCLEVVREARALGSQAVFVVYGNGQHKSVWSDAETYYLQCPFTEEEFEQVFLKAYRKYEEKQRKTLDVMIGKMPEKLPIHEIRYISVENRVVYAHMEDEIYRFYASLTELEEMLNGEGFIRVHRGYLVNGKFVCEYRSGHVVMEDGTALPVGRNYRDGVRDIFN